MNRLVRRFRLRRKRNELELKRAVLVDRLIQTTRVYLREWNSPVPDTTLRHNDRGVMRQLIQEIDAVDRSLRAL